MRSQIAFLDGDAHPAGDVSGDESYPKRKGLRLELVPAQPRRKWWEAPGCFRASSDLPRSDGSGADGTDKAVRWVRATDAAPDQISLELAVAPLALAADPQVAQLAYVGHPIVQPARVDGAPVVAVA